MNKSIIYIKNNTVIHNNIEYNYEELKKCKKLSNKRILFILDQELFTKKMDYNKNQSVNNLILSAFGNDEDYLFHYDFVNKKREVVVYAIKGGNSVLFLCEDAKKVKVIPIQIYISSNIIKKIKQKTWGVIFEFKSSYYYISYKDNFINCSYVENNINNLIERIKDYKYVNNLYVDNNISSVKLGNKDNNNISIKEFLDEKGIWKQRFFTL